MLYSSICLLLPIEMTSMLLAESFSPSLALRDDLSRTKPVLLVSIKFVSLRLSDCARFASAAPPLAGGREDDV